MSAIDQAFIRAYSESRAARLAKLEGQAAAAGGASPAAAPQTVAATQAPRRPHRPATVAPESPSFIIRRDDAQVTAAPSTTAAAPAAAAAIAPARPAVDAASQAPVVSLAMTESLAQPLSSFSVQPRAKEQFRPALEVDRFIWPTACGSLLAKAEARFDRVADELIAEAALGRKVVAVSGCHRGEGRTLLLLCVARRLVAGGVNICVVDADFAKPELAHRLGMAPQMGWESVLSGDQALCDVLVESLVDRLTLLPLCEKLAADDLANCRLRGATGVAMLRDHYDLVLVDTGPILQPGAEMLDAGWNIDSVLLTRDVRSAPAEQLARAEEKLRATGIPLAGILENFVAP